MEELVLSYALRKMGEGFYLAKAGGWSGYPCELCGNKVIRDTIVAGHSESRFDGIICEDCLKKKGILLNYVW